jgi:hypothetical protein
MFNTPIPRKQPTTPLTREDNSELWIAAIIHKTATNASIAQEVWKYLTNDNEDFPTEDAMSMIEEKLRVISHEEITSIGCLAGNMIPTPVKRTATLSPLSTQNTVTQLTEEQKLHAEIDQVHGQIPLQPSAALNACWQMIFHENVPTNIPTERYATSNTQTTNLENVPTDYLKAAIKTLRALITPGSQNTTNTDTQCPSHVTTNGKTNLTGLTNNEQEKREARIATKLDKLRIFKKYDAGNSRDLVNLFEAIQTFEETMTSLKILSAEESIEKLIYAAPNKNKQQIRNYIKGEKEKKTGNGSSYVKVRANFIKKAAGCQLEDVRREMQKQYSEFTHTTTQVIDIATIDTYTQHAVNMAALYAMVAEKAVNAEQLNMTIVNGLPKAVERAVTTANQTYATLSIHELRTAVDTAAKSVNNHIEQTQALLTNNSLPILHIHTPTEQGEQPREPTQTTPASTIDHVKEQSQQLLPRSTVEELIRYAAQQQNHQRKQGTKRCRKHDTDQHDFTTCPDTECFKCRQKGHIAPHCPNTTRTPHQASGTNTQHPPRQQHKQTPKGACHFFPRGECRRNPCRFSHNTTPQTAQGITPQRGTMMRINPQQQAAQAQQPTTQAQIAFMKSNNCKLCGSADVSHVAQVVATRGDCKNNKNTCHFCIALRPPVNSAHTFTACPRYNRHPSRALNT